MGPVLHGASMNHGASSYPGACLYHGLMSMEYMRPVTIWDFLEPSPAGA